MITIIEIVLVIAIIKWAFGKELYQWWSRLDDDTKDIIRWVALGVAVLSLIIWLGTLAWGTICLLWSKLTHDAQCVLCVIPVFGLLYLWAHWACWMNEDNLFATIAKHTLLSLIFCLILGCTISAIFGNIGLGYGITAGIFVICFFVGILTSDNF